MKVKELIDLLKTFPADYEVILSIDPEGNGFSPLDAYCAGMYSPNSGDFNSTNNQAEDQIHGFKENTVCLWP